MVCSQILQAGLELVQFPQRAPVQLVWTVVFLVVRSITQVVLWEELLQWQGSYATLCYKVVSASVIVC